MMIKTSLLREKINKLFSSLPIWSVFVLFFGFYALYFIKIILESKLVGNLDIYWGIAYGNELKQVLTDWWQGIGPTHFLYLNDQAPPGEKALGVTCLFLFFRLLTFTDVYAHYLTIVTVFTLNSFFLYRYLVFNKKFNSKLVVVLTCFTLNINSFFVGNIDTLNIVFLPFIFYMMSFFESIDERLNLKDILKGGSLCGLQIYFSIYLFLFMSIFILINFIKLKFLKKIPQKYILLFCMAYIFSSLPMILFNIMNHDTHSIVDFGRQSFMAAQFSIKPMDVLTFSKKIGIDYDGHNLCVESKHWANLGYELYFLFLCCLWIFRSYLSELFLLLIGIFISVLLYNLAPFLIERNIVDKLFSIFRFPSRAYVLVVIAIVVMGYGFIDFFLKGKKEIVKYSIIFCLVLLRVVSIGFLPFNFFLYQLIPRSYYEYFKNRDHAVVFNLTSGPYDFRNSFSDNHLDMFPYNREIIYMNWKTYLPINIRGGIHGHLTKNRYNLDQKIEKLLTCNSDDECHYIIKELLHSDLDYLVIHKNLILKERFSYGPNGKEKRSESYPLSHAAIQSLRRVFSDHEMDVYQN